MPCRTYLSEYVQFLDRAGGYTRVGVSRHTLLQRIIQASPLDDVSKDPRDCVRQLSSKDKGKLWLLKHSLGMDIDPDVSAETMSYSLYRNDSPASLSLDHGIADYG